MCGIVGIAARAGSAPRDWLGVGRDQLGHRGPDDRGEWWSADGCVGLAHRRLSIIDLSAAGHQPMLTAAGDLCIAYNGEIYNFKELRTQLAAGGHTFSSDSDTEVILAAYREWGAECLVRLHGMFAFALYDARRRHLLLARDRAGEKPLFYRKDERGIRFASELKALLADNTMPRRLDWRALDCYLADGYVAGDLCILEGTNKLPPAHALSFDLDSGATRSWRYWQPPIPPAAEESEAALLEELEQVLQQAVRRQLVADVPVGVLLSGGVDSSLVTALAVRAQRAVKTFTVRFPGYGSYDETEHARLIARHFGTDHVEIDAEAAQVAMLPMLARQFDEPIIDSSMVPTYLVSRVVRNHCTVALGGDGGDELFGGYPHYDRMLRMAGSLRIVPRSVRCALSAAAGRLVPPGVRGRSWLRAADTDLHADVPAVLQIFDAVTRKRLLQGNRRWAAVAESLRRTRLPSEADLLQRATRLDFESYLAEDLLVKVDRASMLSSLEVRAPLLDVAVIEFAFGRVPSRLKATRGARKILLKKLAARLLPPSFDRARKQGFSIPLSSWLSAGPWREFFREVLLDGDTAWFDRKLVTGMLDGERRGRANGERLYGLVMFELWRREYRVDMGG
ncbi:MAG TPA: asparagine synthase (glutamine-hydrolyzing) [Steroidobacteraceae bacterium]|nr:asparagine synthase (glutamine-hydrolyzing) [Steroidobacteraceae bacterium]